MSIKKLNLVKQVIDILKLGKGKGLLFFSFSINIILVGFDLKTISLVPNLVSALSGESGQKNIALLFCFYALLSGLIRVLLSWVGSKVNAKISSNIGKSVIAKIYNYDVYSLEKIGGAKLSQILITDLDKISTELIYPLLQLITGASLTIGIVGFLLTKSATNLFIITSILAIIYFLFIRKVRKKLYNNSQERVNLSESFAFASNEIVFSRRYLNISKKIENRVNILTRLDRRLKQITAQNAFLATFPKYVSETSGLLILALIGYYSTLSGGSSIGQIGLLALCVQKLVPSVQTMFVAYANIKGCQGNIDRILTFCNHQFTSNISSKNILEIAKKRIKNLTIIKNNLNSQKKPLLKIKVSKDKKRSNENSIILFESDWLGITGASGSGKTTLLDLITNSIFYIKDNSSKKLVDNNFANKLTDNLSFIYVSQANYMPDAAIFSYVCGLNNDDIIDNISYKKAFYWLSKFGIAEELNINESSNDIFLGELGTTLSGGQAQRINLARGMFQAEKSINESKKLIIVLDESLSGINTDLRFKCLDIIKKSSSSVIMVSHHSEDVPIYCNKIINLL